MGMNPVFKFKKGGNVTEYSLYQFLNGKYADYKNAENQNKPKKAYERIVVLGGSFNPPTKAHLELLKTAADAVNADCGLFAPAPYGYVKKNVIQSVCELGKLR